MLLGLAVLAVAAGRVGISAVPLYLLAGLLVGTGGLYPLTQVEGFIEVGAQLGVILLLLMLGLEYSPSDLSRGVRRGWLAGIADLVLNATPGVVAGILLGFGPIGAAALGGITYNSSSGVIAKVITDLRLTANREISITLTLTVVGDLVMAIYLPLLAAAFLGANVAGVMVAIAVVVAVLTTILHPGTRGPRWTRQFFARGDEAALLGLLGISLLLGALADRLGVSAAVAAFLIGLALSGDAAESATRLLRPLRDLFAAAFFLFFGMQVDPAALGPVAWAAATLGVLTAATKMATGWWAAKQDGVGTWGRRRAGALLIARGEFSVIIAGLAISAGIDPRLGTLAAAYVMATAITGPLAVRAVEAARLRNRRSGSRPARPRP